MTGRLLPVALLLVSVAAGARGARELAFYALVAAVPAASVCALSLFGDAVEAAERHAAGLALRLETALAAVGLVLLVAASAVLGQADGPAPDGTALAVTIALVLYTSQAALGLLAPHAAERPDH